MRTLLLAAALGLGVLGAPLPAANAQETGLHKLHAIGRVGGKACMLDHEHAGQSLPTGKKEVAIKLAILKWQQFTADEYGRSWGSWALAAGKKQSCTGGNGSWVCDVTARPCKGRR